MPNDGHHLVYLYAAFKPPCDALMAEIMEGEVGYIRSCPQRVP